MICRSVWTSQYPRAHRGCTSSRTSRATSLSSWVGSWTSIPSSSDSRSMITFGSTRGIVGSRCQIVCFVLFHDIVPCRFLLRLLQGSYIYSLRSQAILPTHTFCIAILLGIWTLTDLPNVVVDVVSRNRPFFTFVYAHPRYFKDHATFKAAQIEAGGFNVLRRLDDDSDHGSMFDDDGAIVALVRSKASLWIRPKKDPSDKEEDALGVLLIDPSIKSGFPLWCGYRPFENSPTPSQRQQSYEAPERKSLFDDLIFWIKKMTQRDMDKIRTNPNVMAYRISQIICAEWLSLSRYASTRLRQIEWEVERPAFRRQPKEGVDSSLSKSHTWRRRLPLYRTMVADTRKHLFQKDPKSSSSSSSSSSSANNKDKDDDKDDDNCVADLADDFANVARNLDDLLQQTERITAVTTAVAAFEESRRAVEQNQSLGRLTYLAVIFAPLSFVSSFFSMAPDVVDLAQTFWIYFCVAVPVSIGVYLVVENSWHATLKTWYAGDVEGSGGDNTTIMAWFRKMNVGKRGHVRDGDTLLQGGGAAAVGVQQGMTATTMGNGNDPMVKK
ncbi:hypothetical protein F4778DRAFT_740057 [Xylariomycetidae sp. FL2044]|nr:hypothetical protein F4778DRAFT_740057 [Xylariomycetidae sp. FL2044]